MLFRSDIGGENWVDTTYGTISTDHLDTGLCSFDEGLEDGTHAMVEEPVPLKRTARSLGEALKLRDRQVPNEHGRAL